ncbi:hypothetical protein B0H63DRAFT_471067 [Podospora didyma]|uniref:Glycine-rich domain-containing protein 1 n=1 Tax=Podospora didyma TaxID=330526 RepID=A0AAE0NUJ5_9PEZI|nr:hypothetical protein B0H63DRAFT_471067 [Podospora didyma]
MVLDCAKNKHALHHVGKAATSQLYQGIDGPASKLKEYRLAETPDEEPTIPNPDIFKFEESSSSTLSSSSSTLRDSSSSSQSNAFRFPLSSECAAHLELLEVFFVLRQRILRSVDIDHAMGIAPVRETKTGHNGDTKTFKDTKLWERRQDKWPKFLEFAVVRFLEWRNTMMHGRPQDEHSYLPPLDVIMVWHSFMLNPRLFQEYCVGTTLYKIRMPWKKIHEFINNRDWNFNYHADAARSFETSTGLAPDLFQEFSTWARGGVGPDEPEEADGDAEPPVPLVSLAVYKLEGEMEIPPVLDSLKPTHPARKYMSCFQAADKDLAIQLRDAVIRQTAFVDKMNAHMWIRSPGLAGTLRRGIERYDKFLKLLKLYPSTTIVPTLDIDLAWHTHQCSAVMYAKGMKDHVGRFINHDDSIVQGKLDVGFAQSRRYFRIHFGQEYRLCGCWDCEALLCEMEDAVAAAAGEEDGKLDMSAIAKRVDEQVMYYRLVEVARRKKQALPIRTT